MQITTTGRAKKDFAPDQIEASAIFNYRALTYDEALMGGVEKVKKYINSIIEITDFTSDDFKTNAYIINELYHINYFEPKTEADLNKKLQKRVLDGFSFTQRMKLEFDYDKMRLAKLLAASSRIPEAPMLRIEFTLKDTESKMRELIPIAYNNAKQKAEALVDVAGKNLGGCVHVDIDGPVQNWSTFEGVAKRTMTFGDVPPEDFVQQIRNIEDTFNPDDITLVKEISCIWETSN